MLLTIFLAIVFCAAITLMLLSAVAFIQKNSFFSSAPKETRAVLKPRDKELFAGAHLPRSLSPRGMDLYAVWIRMR